MRIGIIGGGVVGRATARAFLEHVDEVRIYDRFKERSTADLISTLETDLVFVCLPTPQAASGLECDLRDIDGFFRNQVPDRLRGANFVLRSTVPIGTTRRLREGFQLTGIVHSPEFLTARCAMVDAQMPARNIIGSFAGGAEGSNESKCFCALYELYERRFPGVPIYTMTAEESEAVKLFQNGFFAVKVAYWNEVRRLADKLGLNWKRVMDGILADGRIAPSHTQVPGPDGMRGFGGGCLAKDLASLVDQIQQNIPQGAWVTKAAMVRNEEIDRK